MTKKNYITAALSLALAVAIMIYTGMNFMAARDIPWPEQGPSVTDIKLLSDWFPGLKDTNGDTWVYVLQGQKPGGKMLVLGGTHANEVSGYMAAYSWNIMWLDCIWLAPLIFLGGHRLRDPLHQPQRHDPQ